MFCFARLVAVGSSIQFRSRTRAQFQRRKGTRAIDETLLEPNLAFGLDRLQL